ncbi:MAG: Cell division protein FtsX [Verrucomicrobiaceae bacterium]|nr:Cell division protein FtsX [Verrucomicrobiaceae bacterium]
MSEMLRADVRKSAASPRRINRRDRLAAYSLHHRQVARDSLLRLLRNPFGSLATWLVIGIALALPGALYLALGNLAQLSGRWDGAPQISLFLQSSLDEAGGQALQQKISRRGDVAHAEYISREQALAEFRSQSGFGQVIDQLETNPLPALISVRPLVGQSGADAVQKLFGDLKAMPEVERALLDMEWVQRLYALLDIGRRIAFGLATMLGVGVVLVIGNTIRLAIESRRNEILVVKLVGGTNAFVRRPFLYTGIWFGLGGGIVACLILSIALLWLGDPVAHLAALYHSEYALTGLGVERAITLLVGGALLGWLGAWLAVGRHLGAIEPR